MVFRTMRLASFSYADNYPSRPITIEAPYNPGASVDIMARMIAEYLNQKFHQPVIVENHAGVGGQLGLNRVVRAKPDGYTLGEGQITNMALSTSVMKANMNVRQKELVT